MRHTPFLMLAFAAAPLAAQQVTHSIAPGMSRAQVVTAFGDPITARDQDAFTYLFYRNTCGRTCGMNDIVILRRDSVVDAVLRSPDRHYAGKSSSPVAIPPRVAAHLRAGEAPPMTMPAAAKPKAVKPASAKSTPTKPTPVKAASPASGPARPAPVTSGPPRPVPTMSHDTAKGRTPMRPAPATDTRPSIPLKPELVTPAPKKP